MDVKFSFTLVLLWKCALLSKLFALPPSVWLPSLYGCIPRLSIRISNSSLGILFFFFFIQTKVSSVGIWTQFWYMIYRPWLSSSYQFLCLWKENHFLFFFRPTFRGWTDSTLLTMKWAKCLWGEECDQMAPLPLLEVIGWASPSPQWVFLEAPLRAWGWVCPLGLIWPCHLMISEGTLQYRNQRAHINIIIRPTLPGESFLIT